MGRDCDIMFTSGLTGIHSVLLTQDYPEILVTLTLMYLKSVRYFVIRRKVKKVVTFVILGRNRVSVIPQPVLTRYSVPNDSGTRFT